MRKDINTLVILSKKNPVYPAKAKADKDILNGPVVLLVTIDKDGSTEHIELTKSLREDYDRSAIDAVREWKFQPYLLNGQPVEVDTTVTITYSIAP
jgi:TonB family protein